MLCILDVFYFAVFFIIASLCFSLFLFVLHFSLVGSAHTRSLFVKSETKNFCVLLLLVLFLSLCEQVGCFGQLRAFRPKNAAHFWFPLSAYLFFIRFALFFRF